MSVPRALWIEGVVAAVLSGIMALALMGSVVLAPQDRVYGLPSDPLAEVWRLAQFDRGEVGLVANAVSHQANAPSGARLRRPVDASQILYDVPASLLARLLGPVLAYNTLVLLALWTAALAAYGSLRWLGLGLAGAALAAVLFAFGSIHVIEVQLHVALGLVFVLPLLLALGVRALQVPTALRGALFGAAVGLCGYLAGYLFLEALVLTLALTVAAALRFATYPPTRLPLGRAVGSAALTALTTLTPLIVVLAAYHQNLGPNISRPLSDVAGFSLQARSYLDPDVTSYIGAVGLGFAVAGVVVGDVARSTRLTIVLVGLVGFLASMRPEFSLLGADLPMPSKVIHSIVPYWRVFGRTAIVAALAVGALSGLLVDRLASSPRTLIRVAAVTLALIAVVDVVDRPPPPAADLGRPDPIAERLRNVSGAVAEYPLWGFDNYRLGPYLLRQLRHGRPLLNGSLEDTVSADLSAAASTLDAPEAREALTLAGVRTVVVHPTSPAPRGSGFRLQSRLADGTSIYSVHPVTHAVVASPRGAYAVEAGPEGSPFQWLGPGASLRVVAAGAQPVSLAFDAVSIGAPRTVRFGAERRVVSTAPTPVNLCVQTKPDGSTTIPITMTPGPSRLPGGDPRVAGIGVFHLHAAPGCAHSG